MDSLRPPYDGGNNQFKGNCIVRWCAVCGTHRPQLGGRMKPVMGGTHWVCARHTKAVPNA